MISDKRVVFEQTGKRVGGGQLRSIRFPVVSVQRDQAHHVAVYVAVGTAADLHCVACACISGSLRVQAYHIAGGCSHASAGTACIGKSCKRAAVYGVFERSPRVCYSDGSRRSCLKLERQD